MDPRIDCVSAKRWSLEKRWNAATRWRNRIWAFSFQLFERHTPVRLICVTYEHIGCPDRVAVARLSGAEVCEPNVRVCRRIGHTLCERECSMSSPGDCARGAVAAHTETSDWSAQGVISEQKRSSVRRLSAFLDRHIVPIVPIITWAYAV